MLTFALFLFQSNTPDALLFNTHHNKLQSWPEYDSQGHEARKDKVTAKVKVMASRDLTL